MHYFLAGWFSGLLPVGVVLVLHFVKQGFRAGLNFRLDD